MIGNVFSGKTVWISGHTGFKGAWLVTWLRMLGAKVYGFALEPPTKHALFDQLGLAGDIHHEIGEVTDPEAVRQSIRKADPDFVFHLAAQSIVGLSYRQPSTTFAVNVMGTVHVLDVLREFSKPCVVVVVTSDKCYENLEWVYGYREVDPLGGHDPYSASKAAAEIVTAGYRKSFFQHHPVRLASARAGNVIGGGDWSPDRILPDCIRSLQQQRKIGVRNPKSVRPWQHVLEPLSGYLQLAACMAGGQRNKIEAENLASAFNFGPEADSHRTVEELVNAVLQHWPGRWESKEDPDAVHEACLLQLSTEKARALLGWRPVWKFDQCVKKTVEWYQASAAGASPPSELRSLTEQQIHDYEQSAAQLQIPWTRVFMNQTSNEPAPRTDAV